MTAGRPTVEPASPGDLERFVSVTPDGVVFDVHLTIVDSSREYVSEIERVDGVRPSGAPCYRLQHADENGETQVGVEFIDRIVAFDSPLHRDEYAATDRTDLAAELEELASGIPRLVDPDHVTDLLGTDETAAVATRAFVHLVAADAGRCESTVPALLGALQRGVGDPNAAVTALREIASETPNALVPVADRLGSLASSDDESLQTAVLEGLAAVAGTDPIAVLGTIPSLDPILADETDDRCSQAAYIVGKVARAEPDAVRPLVPRLTALLDREDVDDETLMNATIALGQVAGNVPGVVTDAVPGAISLLDAPNPKVRNNAAGMLADLAGLDVEAVVPYVDAVISLVEDDDEFVRTNATAILARIAAADRSAVRPHTDQLVDALEDDQRLVRTNACWALGHLRATEGRRRLRQLRESDPDESVRERAAWALTRMSGGRA